jgi:hypothetical protein
MYACPDATVNENNTLSLTDTFLRVSAVLHFGKVALEVGESERRAFEGVGFKPGDGVFRKLHDAALAGLGHAAVKGDGTVFEVDFFPGEAGELGGPEAGEQAKRDVGQEQAIFAVAGGNEQAAAIGKAENLGLGLVHLGAVDLVHRVGGGVFAADGPVKEVADGEAVVDLVPGRGALPPRSSSFRGRGRRLICNRRRGRPARRKGW